MVSNIGFRLNDPQKIVGFGYRHHHHATRGTGIRKTVGAISRPLLTFVANKVADIISGEGTRKRKPTRKPRTISSGSYKLSGMGRKPKTHKPKRTTITLEHLLGIHKTRKPRATLGGMRKRVRRVLY